MTSYWLAYRGTRFPVRKGETILGRSAYSTVVVRNARVSREHAAIRLEGDRIEITDLGSTNGTTVNGEPLAGPRQLVAGDSIGVGTETVEVVVDTGPGRMAQTTSRQEAPPIDEPRSEIPTTPEEVSLELIEALVTMAASTERTPQAAQAVRRAVDQVLRRPGVRLVGRETERLAVAVRTVASWFRDGSFDAWRDGVIERLERTRTR